MAGLRSLPPEVIRQILSGDASYLFVALWNCGNRALQEKIKVGGCAFANLHDECASSTSRYPTSLRHLQELRTLTIVRNGQLAPSLFASEQLRLLSRTLQKLEIRCENALKLLLRSPVSLRVIRADKPRGSKLWNIGETYPNLTSLTAWEYASDSNNSVDISMTDLTDILPQSLTELKLSIPFGGGDLTNILPPRIETLQLVFISGIVQWPPSLTSIGKLQFMGYSFTKVVETLPRELRTLQTDGLVEFAIGTALALPPALENLSLSALETDDVYIKAGFPSWVHALPKNLTYLRCPLGYVFRHFDIHHLPRTITCLDNFSVDFDSLDKHCFDNGGILQNLENTLASWPPSLTSLSFSDDSNPIEYERYLQFLPNTLKRLKGVRIAKEEGMHEDDHTVPFLWSHFPSSLESLSISKGYIAFTAQFPPLHTLKVASDSYFMGTNQCLPPTLTNLTIPFPLHKVYAPAQNPVDKDDSAMVLSELSNPFERRQWADFLPSNGLTRLTIGIAWDTGYGRASSRRQNTSLPVEQLAACLRHHTTLTALQLNEAYDPEILASLPPHLKRLTCDFSVCPTAAQVRAMHCPELTYAQINSIIMPREIVNLWPERSSTDFYSDRNKDSPWTTRHNAILLRSRAFPDPRVMLD